MSEKIYINNWRGIPVELSKEVYEITFVDGLMKDMPDYSVGTQVRLIAGVDGYNNKPGYHFSPGFSTVCKVNAETAEYIGIKTDRLRLVSNDTEPQ